MAACLLAPVARADETVDALKAALNQASDKAIASLGKPDGFFKNPDVHIPLPGQLEKGRDMLNLLGLKKQTKALDLAINRAAEAAMPAARSLFVQSVKQMSVRDALGIVKGPQDAATRYFRTTMNAPLTEAFRPIVSKSIADLRVAKAYDRVAGQAATIGLVQPEDANLDSYVTRKALDGLFLMMAREEAAIRKDPLGQANALLRDVFGKLANQ
ncbi:MAG: DUF4197 domain-containing protein [Steroidobacteraceae bacterium]